MLPASVDAVRLAFLGVHAQVVSENLEARVPDK